MNAFSYFSYILSFYTHSLIVWCIVQGAPKKSSLQKKFDISRTVLIFSPNLVFTYEDSGHNMLQISLQCLVVFKNYN